MMCRNEIGKAFFQMLLWKKVCYVEEALTWFNDLQEVHNQSTFSSVEELCDFLQPCLPKFGAYGFEIKISYNPLEKTSTQCGKFFCIVNTVKDKAVQEAPVLPRRRDIVFFNAIIESLLNPDTEDGEDAGNDYLAKAIPVSLLRNPQWIRSVSEEDDKNVLHPAEVGKLITKLKEDKWLSETNIGVKNKLAVWFGPRAIAEIPAVARELRRRQRAGASLHNLKSAPRGRRHPVVGLNIDSGRTSSQSQRSRPGSSIGEVHHRTSQSRAGNGQSLAPKLRHSRRARAQVDSGAAQANGHSQASQGTKRNRFIDSEDDSPDRVTAGQNSQPPTKRTRRRINVENSENNGNEHLSKDRTSNSESSEEIQLTMQGSSDDE